MSTWTTADLASIDAALKSGASEVATADGKKIKFRDQDDLLRLRALIIGAASGRRRHRPTLLTVGVRGE